MTDVWEMKIIVGFDTFFSVINILCALAFIVQMSLMVADFIDPNELNTVTYQLKLRQIPFPVNFKLCAFPGFNQTMLRQHGYLVSQTFILLLITLNLLHRIFLGISMERACWTIQYLVGQVIRSSGTSFTPD